MGINEKAWHVGFKWTIGNEDVPAGAIAVDNTSKQLHICDIADAGRDWNVAVVTDPAVYIHCEGSNAPTDYVKIYHNDTNGIIDCDGTAILTMTASSLAISCDTTVAGDLDITAEDISVTTGKYIYLDGASGNDYLRAATDNNVVLNGATTVKVATGGTAVITVAAAAVTLAQAVTCSTTLGVTGISTFNGAVIMTSSLDVAGAITGTSQTLSSTLGVAGIASLTAVTCSSTLGVAGRTTLTHATASSWINFLDNVMARFGTDVDAVIVLNTAGLAADTTLANVSEGTPRKMATAADSLLISNIANNGDMQFLVSDDGSSWGMLTFNGDDHSAHFGQDDYGVPVTFYGATASSYMKWDEANDYLLFAGAGRLEVGTFATPISLDTFSGNEDIHGAMVSSVIAAAMTSGEVSRNIWSRMKITANQAANVSIYGACLQCRVHTGLQTVALTAGLYSGAWMYFEASDTGNAFTLNGAEIMGGAATVEAAAGQALTSGSVYGIKINSAVADSITVSGLTSFSAIYINAGSGKEPWTTGIKIADNHVVTAIEIGTCTTALTTDAPITSTCAATAAVGVTGTQTSATPGTVRGIYGKETTHSSTTSGNVVGVRGEVTCGGSVSSTATLYGSQGKLIMGSNTISTNSYVCGLFGQMDVSGATVSTADSGLVAPICCDIQGAGTGDWQLTLFYGGHMAAGFLHSLMTLKGKSDYVFDLGTNSSTRSMRTTTNVTGAGGWLRILVDGNIRYINLYTD